VHAAISRCALAVGDGLVWAYPTAHAPAPAPAPSLLTPQQPFLPSEEYIAIVRLFYGSFASTGDVELPLLSPVGPDAP
jgi:hypothetical protein